MSRRLLACSAWLTWLSDLNCNRAQRNENVAKHKDRVSNDDGIQWHSRHRNLSEHHILQKTKPSLFSSKTEKKKKKRKNNYSAGAVMGEKDTNIIFDATLSPRLTLQPLNSGVKTTRRREQVLQPAKLISSPRFEERRHSWHRRRPLPGFAEFHIDHCWLTAHLVLAVLPKSRLHFYFWAAVCFE